MTRSDEDIRAMREMLWVTARFAERWGDADLSATLADLADDYAGPYTGETQ